MYNGERFLDEAIRSIVDQTFDDFELVIADNDSTDRTAEICQRHAAADPRIRYYRNPVNVGGVRNENRTLFLARGEFFKLAAHDDTIDPRFLERCVAALDTHPDHELVYTAVTTLDGDSRVTGQRISFAGTERTPSRRLASIADRDYTCEATYGLMRTSALREVRPQTNHLHSDRVVLCELALRAPFLLVSEPLFLKRHHEDNVYQDWRGRAAWYEPDLKRTGGVRLPHFRQAVDFLAMLTRSRLAPLERVRCTLQVARWAWDMRRSFAMDLVDAGHMLVRGAEWRRRRYADEASWR